MPGSLCDRSAGTPHRASTATRGASRASEPMRSRRRKAAGLPLTASSLLSPIRARWRSSSWRGRGSSPAMAFAQREFQAAMHRFIRSCAG